MQDSANYIKKKNKINFNRIVIFRKSTFRNKSSKTHANPRRVSNGRISLQCSKMPGITLANDEPRKVNPRSVLICEVMVIIAAAEQKPEITGPDMKSIIHPKEK